MRIYDWSLRTKIILHVVVIGFLATLLLAFIYIRAQLNFMHELNVQRSDLIGSMLECNVTHRMQMETPEEIQPALARLVRSSRILRIRILNSDGKILKSSYMEEQGSRIPEKEVAFLHRFYKGKKGAEVFGIRQTSSTQSYMAIRNKPECIRCHSPDHEFNGILDLQLDDTTTKTLLQSNQIKGVAIAVAALAVLVFIIIRLFEKIINRPIFRLKQLMKQVQEGVLDGHLTPRNKDEIGDLTKNFNMMVENLKEAREEIENLHQREMMQAEHLASIGELAAGLAHEIKNPVAGIKGALEVIQKRTSESDPTHEIFGEMIHQAERIHQIVHDLLDYAKPRKLESRVSDPIRFINEAVAMTKAQTRDKEISFHITNILDNTEILLDPHQMQEVILNLLINSVTAIEKKGDIFIDLKIDNGTLVIIHRDNGRGIKEENLPHIFQPFFTTRKSGTGLGLSITRRIIQEHGGTIEAASGKQGGTEFTIRIPLKKKKIDS